MHRSKKELLEHFSKFLTQRMGLSFPTSRMPELERALEGVASDLGFSNIENLIFDLATKPVTPEKMQVLARRLTVGETYFFRDENVFRALEREILPDIIQSRHLTGQHLRVWSAGCCTGEEAYSLAISIRKMLPAWRQWDIKILATDINSDFLEKAASGTYGKWSFRTTSDTIRNCYFSPADDDTETISADLRKMITFKHLNLAEDGYPSASQDIENFDIIFCRNVLMYFSAAQATAALRRLCASLVPGGWLVLGPSELTIRPTEDLVERPLGGLLIYRRLTAGTQASDFIKPPGHQDPDVTPAPAHFPEISPAPPPSQKFLDMKPPPAPLNPATQEQVQDLLRTAKAQGNCGKISEAIAQCNAAIALDKMNPVAHYLHGILLQETGDLAEADRALKRSIYLEPTFIVAHFALGNLERTRGRDVEAAKHFENARNIAHRHLPEETLPESDGLTIGRLVQIIEAFTHPKAE